MGLIDRFFSVGIKKELIDIDNSNQGFFGMLDAYRANDLFTSRRDDEMAKYYRSWVKTAIDAIAERMSMIDFQFRNTKDDKIIDNHPLEKVLHKPNKLMSKSKFIKRITINLLLYGKAPIFKIGIGKNITELRPLTPIGFTAKWNASNTDVEYYYYTQQPDKKYKPEEIIPLYDYHPVNPLDGLSTTRASIYGIESLIELENWVYQFFSSGGVPPFAIIYEQKLNQDQIKAIKERFKQDYAGSNNAFQPMVMSGGARVEKTGLSPKDAELSENERTIRDKVLGQFRVPKAVIGIVDDVNRANSEGSLITFLENNIIPKMSSLVDDLNSFFISPIYPEHYLEYKNPVPKDKKLEAETREKRGKWVTINELREEEGLPPTADGNRFLDSPIISIEASKMIKTLEAKLEQVKFMVVDSQEKSDESIVKWLNKKALKTEGKFAIAIQRYVKGLEGRLVTELKNSKSFSLKKNINAIYNDTNERKLIFDVLENFYKFAHGEAIKEALALLDIPEYNPVLNFDELFSVVLNKSSININNTIKKWIIEDLLIGIEAGEGIEDLVNRIKNQTDYIRDHHAFLIAQTESTKVTNKTYWEVDRKSGAPYKAWVNLGDTRVRESHKSVDVVPMNEPFLVGSSKLQYPGDDNGDAEDVIQCRCRVLPKWTLE